MIKGQTGIMVHYPVGTAIDSISIAGFLNGMWPFMVGSAHAIAGDTVIRERLQSGEGGWPERPNYGSRMKA
jgi:hypothetical protein